MQNVKFSLPISIMQMMYIKITVEIFILTLRPISNSVPSLTDIYFVVLVYNV